MPLTVGDRHIEGGLTELVVAGGTLTQSLLGTQGSERHYNTNSTNSPMRLSMFSGRRWLWLIVLILGVLVVFLVCFVISMLIRPSYILYSAKLYDQREISAVACSPDQAFIAVVWGSDCCDVYDFDLKHRLFHFEKPLQDLCSLTFDPASKRLVTAATGIGRLYDLSNGVIYIWDVHSGKPEIMLKTNLHQILDVSLSPDGKIVAVAGGDWEKKSDKRTVQLFNTEKREEIGILEGHPRVAMSVRFAPDGGMYWPRRGRRTT